MLTRQLVLSQGIEAITEVDTIDDLSDGRLGDSWIRAQVADIMRELSIAEADHSLIPQLIAIIYLPNTDVAGEAALDSLNALLEGKDHSKCVALCDLVIADLYARGDDRIRNAIEVGNES